MNNIPKVSLEDTLYLIQMMRETALSQGQSAQAKRLSPLESEIRGLVTNNRQTAAALRPAPPPASGILGQSDFQKLLEVTKDRSSGTQPASSTNAVLERNRMIQAMSAANMSEMDIARQFGVTRDEVSLVLSVQQEGAAK